MQKQINITFITMEQIIYYQNTTWYHPRLNKRIDDVDISIQTRTCFSPRTRMTGQYIFQI
jgi:hypothetical protein